MLGAGGGSELDVHTHVDGPAHARHGSAPLGVIGQRRVRHGGALPGVSAAGGQVVELVKQVFYAKVQAYFPQVSGPI